MIDRPDPLPDRIASLADLNAVKYIGSGVRSGREEPPYIELGRSVTATAEDDVRMRVEPVRDLVDDVMHLYRDDTRTRADAWLAPRLHAALRLTRREAADEGIWNHLAAAVAPDYVLWRHLPATGSDGGPPMVPSGRFHGAHHTQAFSRLWWAAELFRNGPDYAPVVVACGIQDVLNTVLRLDIIDHRPTAQAVVALVEQGVARTGREVNALAVVANAAASTLFYDVLAEDEERDDGALDEWVAGAASAPPVPRRSLPRGPEDGTVPEKAVAALVERFGELFQDAVVRGRTASQD
ncbi:DUF6339 family protein [Streptomyces liangshanensis]|uniref:Uncharacterized protein n=1 Tax=Streptomyces liangshanensis TaxID=2717324 RepID=A0A6G9H2C2_9ACTN|nr:DUF6339 family protein [Streptomyces liangshanensis]QIQ04655.1 hypothetical protein HA039_22310 [Streptomyces liangshanensis]